MAGHKYITSTEMYVVQEVETLTDALSGEYVVKKFPELKRIYKRQEESKNGYYLKLFEAIISSIK